MRQKTVDYALTPDGNPVRLMKMRSECAALWGAIECVKNGNAPVLASQAKYLQRPPRGCERLNG
jgi:hypothetical protein